MLGDLYYGCQRSSHSPAVGNAKSEVFECIITRSTIFDQHALCFYFQAVMHYFLQINLNYFLAIDLFLIWERGVIGFILL